MVEPGVNLGVRRCVVTSEVALREYDGLGSICNAWEDEEEPGERTSTSESTNLSSSSRSKMMSGRLTESSGETFSIGGRGSGRAALVLFLGAGSDFLLGLDLIFVTLDKF